MARKSKDDILKAGKRKPWAFMSKFTIQHADGDAMLVRWRIIQTPWGGFYLHKWLRGDSDPYVHDHPWSFFSIILLGGYWEVRRNNKTYRLHLHHVTRFNVMHRYDAHYVRTLDRVPTWTLMLVGPRKRTWGFYADDDRQGSGFPEPSLIFDENAVLPNTIVPNQRWIEFDNWEESGGKPT